jgi:short-subunit dehydrogenase
VALVTGASSGIGAAFARALAARGHDLVVVARDTDRLRALAARLEADHGTATEVLAADLVEPDGVSRVAARLVRDDEPVDLLVNNAGFGTSGNFRDLPIAEEEAEIQLNVVALVRLTHAALGPMVARGRGGVINVSSVAAYQATPGSATYGGTKAFVSNFSNALHEELRGTGVKLMVLAPGFTHTEFHERAGIAGGLPEVFWQDADEVVEQALGAYAKGRAVCVPGALNVAAAAFSATLPAGVTRRVSGMVTRRTY